MQPATRHFALLFFACLLFHAAGTWSVPLIDRDEPRFAEASREMIERGDYVIPYFNDDYRFDKPPLTYWAQAASYKIFGQNDFAARFPSAVAAALTALSIFAWGRRIGGDRVGLWAAIIFSLSFQVMEHAKAAVADMWLVFFVTLAHWAGFELIFGDSRRSTFNRWWFAFYLSLAFAFLAKGPIGWAPLLAVVSTIAFLREPHLMRRFKFVRGMVLTLALVSLWGIPALIRTQGKFFAIGIGHHVLERSVSALGGHGARSLGVYLLLLPFFFVTIFLSFFPWSLRLPWLVKHLRAERDKIDIYLLCGIAVVFVIFTFMTTKLLHYTLPAFPLLALLLARRLSAENKAGFVKKCATVTATVCIVIMLVAPPFTAQFFPARALFLQARDYLKPEMTFAALDYREPSLVWYFRSRVRGFMRTWEMHPGTVQPFMEQTGPRFVIVPTAVANKVYPQLPNGWKSFSFRGFNAVKARRSDLTLILKPE